ncbi:MAG: sigma-70 family RNA polymerase sigma factor [Opitutaceae bacterium]|nr:sigma-70 family RNA polymerase sigma factor [Opitutaceae bacterium]
MSSALVSPATASTPESALIEAARAGNQAAFAELMRLHYERMFRLTCSILRHEADARDVCQEIWITVWMQLPEFRGESQFTTWLHPIAVRHALDHLRKRRRWYHRFLPLETLRETDSPVTADPTEGVSDQAAAARRALDTLPPRLRAALALREIEGLSYEEIAAVLKIPVGTVMSRLYHARRMLGQKLGIKS